MPLDPHRRRPPSMLLMDTISLPTTTKYLKAKTQIAFYMDPKFNPSSDCFSAQTQLGEI